MDMTALVNKMADAMDRQAAALEKVVGQKGLHTKAPATDSTATELHGVGSLFGDHSVERDVISAHIAPAGLSSALPWIPSVFEQPRFASITGYTALAGARPTHACADAQAGYVKACNLTAQFGRLMIDTQTIDIDKTVRRANRGDFTDLILHGKILGELGGFTPGNLTQEQILNIVTKNEMVIAGVNMQREAAVMTWTGNPAANSGTGWIPFPGLDRQIATGQVDADSNTLCPALDSDVKDFGYDDIEGTGRDIVEYLQMLEYFLVIGNATRMGLMPAKWALVMRPELWMVLSNSWPCRYNTNRCASVINSGNLNAAVILQGPDNIAMRDAMRNEMRIEINGRTYPVIIDDGIYEDNVTTKGQLKAGEYASSIYFVPLSIDGDFPVTYFEYVDYRQTAGNIALLNGKETFWTDDGRFMWAYEGLNYCFKLKLKTEPRIVLRTPQLAGRIDHVKYIPLQHLRATDPSSNYFADGGVSMRPDTILRHVW
jgi:hypothetical protein